MDLVSNLIHEIKETLRSEPHSLDEIKASLSDPHLENKSVIELIERHHDYLHESIGPLMDHHTPGREKQKHLRRLLQVLEMHGRAEQEVLYRAMMASSSQEARLEGLAGQDEHDIAFHLVEQLEQAQFERVWTEDIDARAKVLAAQVANHIHEEEADILPIAFRDLPAEEMQVLATDYLQRCKIYLEPAVALGAGLF